MSASNIAVLISNLFINLSTSSTNFFIGLLCGSSFAWFLISYNWGILFMQIKKGSFADDNFSISVSKSANEIVATYTKDETGMDLVIRLPPSYPLRPVDIDCTRSLGISEVKRRKWLMSLMSFVRNQVLCRFQILISFLDKNFFFF